jgi:hypothetical protein
MNRPQRALFKTPEDPPLPVGATPCADHPTLPVIGSCARCGRFICSRCDSATAGNRYCGPCRKLLDPVGPVGLGGWLALPGLAMGFVLLVAVIAVPVELGRARQNLSLPGLAHWLLSLGLAIADGTAFLAYLRKKASTPKLVLGLAIAQLVGGASQYLLSAFFLEELKWTNGAGAQTALVALLWGAIWIPYFLLSKRVKATFVVP